MSKLSLLSIVVLATVVSMARAQTYLNAEQSVILNAHNTLRNAMYVSNNLTWSDALVREAQSRAQYQMNICALTHNGHNPNLGENLAMVSGGGIDVPTTQRLLNLWISEGYQPGQYSHWTQMVWSGTQQVGCVVTQSARCGFEFLVCSYYPAGNVLGRTPWTDLNVPYNFGSYVNVAPTETAVPAVYETVYATPMNPNAPATASLTVLPTFFVKRVGATLSTISTHTTLTVTPAAVPAAAPSSPVLNIDTATLTANPAAPAATPAPNTPAAAAASSVAPVVPVQPTATPVVAATPQPTQAAEPVSWPQHVPTTPAFAQWPRPQPGDRTIKALFVLLSRFLEIMQNPRILDALQEGQEAATHAVSGLLGALTGSASSIQMVSGYAMAATLVATLFVMRRV